MKAKFECIGMDEYTGKNGKSFTATLLDVSGKGERLKSTIDYRMSVADIEKLAAEKVGTPYDLEGRTCIVAITAIENARFSGRMGVQGHIVEIMK